MLNSKLFITGTCSEFYCNLNGHTHIHENHCHFMTYFQTLFVGKVSLEKAPKDVLLLDELCLKYKSWSRSAK